MSANNDGKRNLAAMEEDDELYHSADSPEPQKKTARRLLAIDTGIEVQPDSLRGAFNPSRQPTDCPSPPNSPSTLAPNPSHDPAPAASEQDQVRTSAEHLLMLVSGAQQPADILVTQVGIPGGSPSPTNPKIGDVLANVLTEESGRESTLAINSPASPSGYSTPGKLRLQLSGFSPVLAGSTSESAEMGDGSQLQSVSVLAF